MCTTLAAIFASKSRKSSSLSSSFQMSESNGSKSSKRFHCAFLISTFKTLFFALRPDISACAGAAAAAAAALVPSGHRRSLSVDGHSAPTPPSLLRPPPTGHRSSRNSCRGGSGCELTASAAAAASLSPPPAPPPLSAISGGRGRSDVQHLCALCGRLRLDHQLH